MQKYESIGTLSCAEFKRLTGVQKASLEKMVSVVKEAENHRIDLLHNQDSVDFSVLLSRFSSQIRGVISTTSILPHEFDSKIGQNNPKTRRTLGYARGLLMGVFPHFQFVRSRIRVHLSPSGNRRKIRRTILLISKVKSVKNRQTLRYDDSSLTSDLKAEATWVRFMVLTTNRSEEHTS